MKKHIQKVIKHPLVSNSFIVIIGGLAASVCNFIFNLYMSRNLTVTDYGTLASLFSIISLIIVLPNAAAPAIVNFAAAYFAKKQNDLLKNFIIKLNKYYFISGILVLLFFILFPNYIGGFFHIHNNFLIIVSGITIFFVFIGTVNAAILQAKLAFIYLSVIQFIGAGLKVLLGIMLVILGFGVMGSLSAFLIALIVPFVLSFFPLFYLFKRNIGLAKVDMKQVLLYGFPSGIAAFAITTFVSTDILLVKHFFNADQAGIYAGLSLVGRVIFFLTSPIGTVMFPLLSQKHAKKEDYNNTFLLSLIIVLIPSLAITLFYFIFPEFSINVFIKKKEYLQVASLLGLFGIFITLYSLLNVFTNFYLSIRKTKIWIPILVASVAQLIGIWLYHQSFIQIIVISLVATTMLLAYFIVYYFQIRKQFLLANR